MLRFAAAMPACDDRRPDSVERLWSPFGEVEQAVMTRVEPARNWKASGHLDGDPVAKMHPPRREVGSKEDVPLRQVVEEEGTTGLKDPDALVNPRHAPREILWVREAVVRLLAVFLPQ